MFETKAKASASRYQRQDLYSLAVHLGMRILGMVLSEESAIALDLHNISVGRFKVLTVVRFTSYTRSRIYGSLIPAQVVIYTEAGACSCGGVVYRKYDSTIHKVGE